MNRKCGCPYAETNPQNPSQPKTSALESRSALKEVQNRLPRKSSITTAPAKKKQAPSTATKKPATSSAPAPTPAVPSTNVETQTSFKIFVHPAKELKKVVVCETEEFQNVSQETKEIARSTSTLLAVEAATYQDASINCAEKSNGEENTVGKIISAQFHGFNFQRKFKTPHAELPVLNSNSGFICAEKFFERQNNYVRSISPIRPNADIDENRLISMYEDDKAPAQKKTLLRAKRARLDSQSENSSMGVDIYNTEYMSEIAKTLLKNDQKYLVQRNYFYAHNKHLSVDERCEVLNWILKVQPEIRMSMSVYYMFVRLLDNIIADVPIPRNMLQLVAIVSCWILMKNHDRSIPNGKNLAKLCGNAYTTKQLLHTEKKLLCYTKFNLLVSNPCDFLHIYIKHLRVPLNHAFVHCVHYILEMFSLSHRFSTYSSAEIASAVTHLSLKYFSWDISSKLKTCQVYYNYNGIVDIVCVLDTQMKRIYKGTNQFELNIYRKYATPVYMKISVELKKKAAVNCGLITAAT